MKKIATCLFFSVNVLSQATQALPPPEDLPEEILRTEIILYGRSPIDNRALTAPEYVLEQEKIAQSSLTTTIDPKIRELIFLLQVRKFLKTITPF